MKSQLKKTFTAFKVKLKELRVATFQNPGEKKNENGF